MLIRSVVTVLTSQGGWVGLLPDSLVEAGFFTRSLVVVPGCQKQSGQNCHRGQPAGLHVPRVRIDGQPTGVLLTLYNQKRTRREKQKAEASHPNRKS